VVVRFGLASGLLGGVRGRGLLFDRFLLLFLGLNFFFLLLGRLHLLLLGVNDLHLLLLLGLDGLLRLLLLLFLGLGLNLLLRSLLLFGGLLVFRPDVSD
jgi:hypothetical protein